MARRQGRNLGVAGPGQIVPAPIDRPAEDAEKQARQQGKPGRTTHGMDLVDGTVTAHSIWTASWRAGSVSDRSKRTKRFSGRLRSRLAKTSIRSASRMNSPPSRVRLVQQHYGEGPAAKQGFIPVR